MTKSVGVHEAKTHLSRLLEDVAAGEEVVITENEQPVARLVQTAMPTGTRKAPRLGTLRGTVLSMEHFDDPLDDFKECTE